MKKFLFLSLLMLSGLLISSNMGFKATMSFAPSASNQYWVSVPYYYNPADSNSNGQVDAEDMCADATNVASVLYWDTNANVLIGWACGGYGTPFNLTKGMAYQFMGDGTNTITWIAVGSHDPTYQHSYAPSASNQYWVSIPYHTTASNAEDVCTEATNVASVLYWDTNGNVLVGWACGGYGTPFAIDVFKGLQFMGDGENTITWTPSHY